MGYATLEIATRAILSRHVIAAIPLVVLILVEVASLRRAKSIFISIVSVNTLVIVFATTLYQARDGGWETAVPALKLTLKHCPQSRIVALDPHALTGSINQGKRFTGEAEAVRASFRGVADKFQFPVLFADHLHSIDVRQAPCPTIIWMEHNWARPNADPREITIAAGVLASNAQIAAATFRGREAQRATLVIPASVTNSNSHAG